MTTTSLDQAHLRHLDDLRTRSAVIDSQGLRLGDTYVMFFAEDDLMAEHARRLTAGREGARVLEVGLGLGVFAEQLAACEPGAYLAVEPHPGVVDLVAPRVRSALSCPVTVLTQPWQLLDLPPKSADAIMYDTWPPEGHADPDFAAFVERVAVPVLRPGGRFSFFQSGTRLSPARVEVLDRHFPGWTVSPYRLPAARLPGAWTKPSNEFLVPIAEVGVN
ncbi:class I SAM-dependent methyltransferase [Micromonospora chalcea]|uniref:class I SAM-dependent methyltransferase n=1 Tax=Micromonospora chalcea TaxID=1874 RepID=UPI0038F6E0C2